MVACSVDRVVFPGRLLEFVGPPLGHGPKSEDGHDAHSDCGQHRPEQTHGTGQDGAAVGALEIGDRVAYEAPAGSGHHDG